VAEADLPVGSGGGESRLVLRVRGGAGAGPLVQQELHIRLPKRSRANVRRNVVDKLGVPDNSHSHGVGDQSPPAF
jgi:hypothetical protein